MSGEIDPVTTGGTRGVAQPGGEIGPFLPDGESGPVLPGDARGVLPRREWFARPPLDVARDLLGAYLTHRTTQGTVTLRLTEVEAYGGSDDPGSHAFRGVTARNGSMAAAGGHLYAYRHLGLHTCLNVVTGPSGSPAAVLLRGAEVVDGADLATRRRTERGVVGDHRDLARGPARLSVALGVGPDHDGADLLMHGGCLALWVPGHGTEVSLVSTGPRVGVSGDGGDGVLFPWRLWLTDERTVSAYRAVSPRRR